MLLSHKTKIALNDKQSNIIGHMCYAASKLWNVCNYERLHYTELELGDDYPDWYYQKKAHKEDLWYKQMPAQTSQEVCKLLDKSWKSYIKLLKTGGIKNPHPPRYKHESIPITYMQMGIKHEAKANQVRLSLPKDLMEYLSSAYGIHDKFLFLENVVFRDMDNIKQIKIYPPKDGESEIIIIYEVPDVKILPDNGRYLSIDMGIHNLLTCYDSTDGNTFILGRKYLSICIGFAKEIARVQSQWDRIQASKGIKHPKGSSHISKLYEKREHTVNDYLHKITRYLTNYCKEKEINTVIIGDIKGIRKDADFGKKNNQKLHSLPYERIYMMLEYKLKMEGISFVKQRESWSSQCSPLSPEVSKKYADKKCRVKRGLYISDGTVWNADVVGAFNILRLYLKDENIAVNLSPKVIKVPTTANVAV